MQALKPKILKYTVLLSVSLFCWTLSAQTKTQEKKDTTAVKAPFLQGVTVEFDLVPPLETLVSKGVTTGYKANVQVNLKNTWLPVLELGYGKTNKILVNNNGFNGGGMFGKLGLDFNLIKPKTGSKFLNNHLLAGLRLGATHFNYDITNLYLKDEYWGTEERIEKQSAGATKFWFEFTAGIRVEIYKGILLGWSVQNKHLIGSAVSGEINPWYIPGYGKNTPSLWTFSYVIGYKF